jgi:hypothetical protein
VTQSVIEAIAARGRAAVSSGHHSVERPPNETGRWGTSVVLFPRGEVADELDRLTDEVSDLVGPNHWRSGAAGLAHFTVRALQYYEQSGSERASIAPYVAALERAAAGIGPVTLVVRGVIASPSSVMAVATSPDGTADELRRRFAQEIGPDGWLEDRHFEGGRDPIWYVSLVHFASAIDDPDALLRWLDDRSDVPVGTAVLDEVSVCNWIFDGSGMRPERLADVRRF